MLINKCISMLLSFVITVNSPSVHLAPVQHNTIDTTENTIEEIIELPKTDVIEDIDEEIIEEPVESPDLPYLE